MKVVNVEEEIVFQVSNINWNSTNFAYPFSGVFGLSPVFKGDNGEWLSQRKRANTS